MKKICKTCKLEKDISYFAKHSCNSVSHKRYYQAHCKECTHNSYLKLHPKKIAQTTKDNHLRTAFRMTEAEYLKKLSEQNGVCAICKKPETVLIFGKIIALSVDHNHETNKNRGLLCAKCNRGLGCYIDSPELLIAASQYLRSYE